MVKNRSMMDALVIRVLVYEMRIWLGCGVVCEVPHRVWWLACAFVIVSLPPPFRLFFR